jgi:hypothetical protein
MCSSWVAKPLCFLICLGVCTPLAPQAPILKEQAHGTLGLCPATTANGAIVSSAVNPTHPLLQRKRALPWEALCEVMTRHWRRAGKNIGGGPGLPWDVALDVPCVVLLWVKNLNARAMAAYRAAHGVARGFSGRQAAPTPQRRDHANLARASPALGKDGVDEGNALSLHGAKDAGCAEVGLLASDTTAQAWPLGSPNAPGSLRGLAQRCGRALVQRNHSGEEGVDAALAQVETIHRSVQAPHLFAQGKTAKRPGLTRLLAEGGPLLGQTRLLSTRLGERHERVTHNAITPRTTMPEGARRLVAPMGQWITTGVGAQGPILHAGLTPARAIVRTKAGKKVAFGVPYLLRRRGGGDIVGTWRRGIVDESQRP